MPFPADLLSSSTAESSHPGLAHSQDCRTRIEAASRTDPVYCDRAERAEERKMDFYAKKVESIDRPRRTSLAPSVVSGQPTGETEIPRSDQEGEDHSSARNVKRARGESEQNFSVELPILSADETLKPSEILAVPSGSTPSNSTDEIHSGDGITDERLSSWYPETHMSQKMLIETKRKEMERFKRMKVYRVVTRESMERDEEGKMISIKCVVTNKGTDEHPTAKARHVAREFNTGDTRGELFAGTPGLMAMRTLISRAMTRCENGQEEQSCWQM